jgi:hypothetical protein
MSHAERTALSNAARGISGTPYTPDAYDLEWRERYQDRRVARWLPVLEAGAQSMRIRDRHGIQVLWERYQRIGDPQAFFTAALGLIAELQDALDGERSSDEEGEAA